jgi:hypothetical protein
MNGQLVERLVMTAEACGTNLTDGAAALIAAELATYDQAQVAGALRKCLRDLKGRLSLAAIIERLDDGRPGADEAWSMMPFDEAQTVVWSDEMAAARGIVQPLLDECDKVGARMAFREAYTRLVAEARDARKPVNWTASLGHDPRGREGALRLAVENGRLTLGQASNLGLGYSGPVSQDMMALVSGEKPMWMSA